MSRAAEWLKKRLRRRKKIKIQFTITGEMLDVMKSALKDYAETARRSKRLTAEKALRAIEFQEKNN